jgi:soluble lytic murein transglycosylase-like protein
MAGLGDYPVNIRASPTLDLLIPRRPRTLPTDWGGVWDRYDAIISEASRAFGVPVSWIKAVIGTESSFRERALRNEPAINDRSVGLMQLLTRTARGLGFAGTDEELFDPRTNIFLGTQLLAQLRARYGDDFRRVYSAYNSGRPDLYTTSVQVQTHVGRAVVWLERFQAS